MSKPHYRLTTIGQCRRYDEVHYMLKNGRTRQISIIRAGINIAVYNYGPRLCTNPVMHVNAFMLSNDRLAWVRVK